MARERRIVEPGQAREWLSKELKTEPMRAALERPGSSIYQLAEKLNQRGWVCAYPSEPALERKHFSLMWGLIVREKKDTPELQDLWLMHELAHWALADLTRSESHQQWARKWDRNELMASMITEAIVHGEPELEGFDQKALGFKVWARQWGDLRLPEGARVDDPSTWSSAGQQALERRVRLRQGEIEPENDQERWMAGWAILNKKWADLWKEGEAWKRLDHNLERLDEALKSENRGAIARALASMGRESREGSAIAWRRQAIEWNRRSGELAPPRAEG